MAAPPRDDLTAAELRERPCAPGMERCCPRLDGLGRPPTSWAARSATCCAARRSSTWTWRSRATRRARRASSPRGWAASAALHERFGTATVRAGDARGRPGAHATRELRAARGAADRGAGRPRRGPAPARLHGQRDGAGARGRRARSRCIDPHGGADDLDAGRIRVLHERSFIDDPTRLLRALRYAARLGFALEPETERLLASAVEDGALGTVSGPAGARRAAGPAGRARGARGGRAPARPRGGGGAGARRWSPTPSWSPRPRWARPRPARTRRWRRWRRSARADPRPPAPSSSGSAWRPGTATPCCARRAAGPAARRARCASRCGPRQLHALLRREPPETLALALGLGAPGEPVPASWPTCARRGSRSPARDLLAAGVPESPAIGRALEETLRRKLDGELSRPRRGAALALELAGARR